VGLCDQSHERRPDRPAAGSAYSTTQAGGDTVTTLTGGGQMTLVNVQLSGLGEGWIMTI
jgi:hypothetical protein